jgi:hypothetical protein
MKGRLMLTKLKIIGLTAIAALAVSAVAAATAQANPQFHVEEAPATITSWQTTQQVFTTAAGAIACTSISSTGSRSVLTTTTQSLLPTYDGCTTFGFIGAPIHVNACEYVFSLTSDTTAPYDANIAVACPAGKMIEVTGAFGCVLTVGPQTGLTGVSISNNGSKTTRDLNVSLNVTGITYTTAGCSSPDGTYTNGVLHGGATVTADKSAGGQQGLWVL